MDLIRRVGVTKTLYSMLYERDGYSNHHAHIHIILIILIPEQNRGHSCFLLLHLFTNYKCKRKTYWRLVVGSSV